MPLMSSERVNLPILAAVGAVLLGSVGLLTTKYYFLALAVAPTMLIGVLALRRPEIIFFLIVAMVPFDAFRDLGGPMAFLSISKFAGVLLLGIAFLFVVLRKVSLGDLRSNLWLWLLPFLAANLVAALYSVYPDTAWDAYRQMITAVIVFALALLFLRRFPILERMADVIIVSIAISALLSVAGALLGIEALAIGTGEEEDLVRGTGGAKDPNVASSILIFSMPLIAYRIINTAGLVGRLFHIGLFAMVVVASGLTQSRGGFLVLLLTLGMLAWHYRRLLDFRQVIVAVSLVMLGGAVIVASLPDSFWHRHLSLVSGEKDRSLGRRFSYLLVGADAFWESPVIGHGPGTFPELYARSTYAPGFVTKFDTDLHRYAHNSYVEISTGSGLIGLSFYLCFIAATMANYLAAGRLLRRAGQDRWADLASAYRMSLTSLCIYMLIISQVNIKYLWAGTAVSAVFLALARREAKAAKERALAAA